MSRRPSVASLSSIGSSVMKPIQLPAVSQSGSRQKRTFSSSSLITPSRTISLNGNLDAIFERPVDGWDPDELFTKHTVAEVRAIQRQYRADADAKQEELRLMVGERYRDLLQASTSIISIAQSSDNVLSALEAVRDVTSSLKPHESAEAASGGQGDEHLQSLQSLAAHLKLLLDAPEHLWRFMERKLYLHAAWLFLLSRVVHRSLLREEEDEDATWYSLGIHISEQFPIVQRQWDAVSQFRSQISHKATMALREHSATPPEVCAILLTLHLLESRPLPETLATFLAQRSRSLTSTLNRSKDRIPNGSAPEASSSSQAAHFTKSPKVVMRDVRQRLKAVLDVVVRTMGTSRTIFLQRSGEDLPLMHDVLRFVQGEDDTLAKPLPSEVRLSSQTLLTSLPSSNHFLLLPTSVKSYRPYVDDSPLLASEQGDQFTRKLQEWFQKALQSIKTAMEIWFTELSTIHDLWEIRRWCKAWLRKTNGLDTREIGEFEAILNGACREQAVRIWKSALKSTDEAFRQCLSSSIAAVRQSNGDCPDVQPVQYLFHAFPISAMTHVGAGSPSSDSAFQKYRHLLQRQVAARTPLLDDVLGAVEERVLSLRKDLDTMQGEGDDTRVLSSQLVEEYRPDAEATCVSLCNALQTTLDDLSKDISSNIPSILFLGRMADQLASSTLFIDSIGCGVDATKEFRAILRTLWERTVERWQEHAISGVISSRWTLSPKHDNEHLVTGELSPSPRPSSKLLDSLLTLESGIQNFGIHSDPTRLSSLIMQALRYFVVALIKHLGINAAKEIPTTVSWDLVFLLLLAESWGPESQEIQSLLLDHVAPSSEPISPHVREGLSDWLSRLQVLLGLLLPPTVVSAKVDHGKPSSLLQFGLPTVDTQNQSAFELVKPSARFGLLLVGSSVAR